MTYKEQTYRFDLYIQLQDRDGSFRGSITWPDFNPPVTSIITGKQTGDMATMVDGDGDQKDVTLDGWDMRGTDKNGEATFVARRVGAPGDPPPEPEPTKPAPTQPVAAQPAPVKLTQLSAPWQRWEAACQGLAASTYDPSLGGRCWRTLALTSKETAACEFLRTDAVGCKRAVIQLGDDVAACGDDALCLTNAARKGGGEALCERLKDRVGLAQCLAAARKSALPCAGLDANGLNACFRAYALSTGDAKACSNIPEDVFRAHCVRDVGIAFKSAEICMTLEANATVDSLAAIARKDCLDAVNPRPQGQDCRKQPTPGAQSVCWLVTVANGGAASDCGNIFDATLRQACDRVARLPAGKQLDL